MDDLGNPLDVAAQFVVDESTKRVLVRIYNRDTGETIRTIPPTQLVGVLLQVFGAGSVHWFDRSI